MEPQMLLGRHAHCESCYAGPDFVIRQKTLFGKKARLNECGEGIGCPFVFCENGCGAAFHGCKLGEHELLCSTGFVPCINAG
jgi:hypothetical protein